MEDTQQPHFTRRETRAVITPFAFSIDENLFGMAIAAPWKRGVAMLIDLLLIAILSSAGGEFLALAIAIAAFRFGSKKRAKQLGKTNGGVGRATLRFFGAFIIFVLLLHILPPLLNNDNPLQQTDYNSYDTRKTYSSDEASETQFDLAKTLELTGFIIKVVTEVKEKGCDQELPCWREVMLEVPEQALSLELSQKQAEKLFDDLVSELPLTNEDRTSLAADLKASYSELLAQKQEAPGQPKETATASQQRVSEANETSEKGIETPAEEVKHQSDTIASDEVNTEVETEPVENETPDSESSSDSGKAAKIKEKATKPIYSIVEYFKALIRDLGLGFGWAAFYFTVCGALFNGKTPGKKLMGIRVIQLDGTRLSLWDSFGRYGGYGAGLATGLLGFIQIYWDANRQAIQDKISATVVIDERKTVAPELVAMARAKHDVEATPEN